MRNIFTNPELEAAITDKGYTVIKQFATEELCADLASFYSEFKQYSAEAFTISNWNTDEQYRHAAHLAIAKRLFPIASTFLNKFKPVMGVFAAKQGAEKSKMPLHQDWALVDETKFRSVSVWLALCDMDFANGNLQVAERSHLYAGFPRGVNVPVPFEAIQQEMETHCLTNIPLSKGDAIVFDHRLIHSSPDNTTEAIRLAAVLALIPEEAEMLHYFKPLDNDHQLEVLKMEEEHFHLMNFFDGPNKPPHVSSLGFIPASFPQISMEDVRHCNPSNVQA